MISEKQVVEFLRSKDKDYIFRLIALVFKLDDRYDGNGYSACPICGSIHIKKNGKDKHGNQRYYCKDCHKSFNNKTNTLLSWSHLTLDQWRLFIDLEISRMTLKEEAYYLGVSQLTCFYMRHKLYHSTSEIMDSQVLSGEVEIDTDYLKINLKGTKPENMPRRSKKRGKRTKQKGKQSRLRGVSHHQVSVICAVDDTDHMMMKVTGLGSESFEKYKSHESRFKDVKEFISDSKSCIQQFANYLGTFNNKIPTSPAGKKYLTKDGKSLGAVNQMMQEVEDLIILKKGISTRYLQGYLDFNLLRKQIGYKYERNEMTEKILEMVIRKESFKNEMVLATEMPISLKEAYYEYHYGIFAE